MLGQLPREAAGTVLYEMDDGSRLSADGGARPGRGLPHPRPDAARRGGGRGRDAARGASLPDPPRDAAGRGGGDPGPPPVRRVDGGRHHDAGVHRRPRGDDGRPGARPPPEVGDTRGRLLRLRRRQPRSPGRPRPAATAHHRRPVDLGARHPADGRRERHRRHRPGGGRPAGDQAPPARGAGRGPEPAAPGHGHHRRRDRRHPRGGHRGHPPPGRRLGRRDDLRPGEQGRPAKRCSGSS